MVVFHIPRSSTGAVLSEAGYDHSEPVHTRSIRLEGLIGAVR